MDYKLFVCDCGNVDHQFIISSFDDEFIDIQIHLSDVGFWSRLKYAFLYVIGKKSRYNGGAFGEILLNREQTVKLIETLKNYVSIETNT